MPMIKLDDCEVYYETHTKDGHRGPCITLINGFTRTASDFRLMTKELVEQGFFVVCFDNRAVGKTTCSTDFSLTDIAADAVAIWRELKVEQSSVLGISMGGVVAQILAQSYPESVERLILVSTTANTDAIDGGRDTGWGTTQAEVFQRMSRYVSLEFAQKNRLLIEAMSKNILGAIEKGSFLPQAAQQRRAYKANDFALQPEKIGCRTLVLHGEQDQIIDVSEAKFLASRLQHGKLRVLPGIGHLLLAECPKVLYQEVLSFIGAPDGDSVHR